jgi:TraB/PrgY/gumN family
MHAKTPVAGLLTALVLASMATSAMAQTRPPTDDPNAIVEELVVTARYPGPAYWRVSDADSEVWILAVPSYIPNGFVWDKSRTQQVLKGANSLILPSVMSAGISEAIWFGIKNRKKFNNDGNRTLAEVLPAPAIAHYEQLPAPYQTANIKTSTLKPIFSGFSIFMGAAKAGRWSEAETDIIAMAKKAKIKIRFASVTSALVVAKAAMDIPEAQQAQCFDGFIDNVDEEIKTIRPAAEAWADGRTAEFLHKSRGGGMPGCLFTQGELSHQRELSYQTNIKTIKAALDQPGKTLMIANIGMLVAQNGILARLKAEGLTVRTPAD